MYNRLQHDVPGSVRSPLKYPSLVQSRRPRVRMEGQFWDRITHIQAHLPSCRGFPNPYPPKPAPRANCQSPAYTPTDVPACILSSPCSRRSAFHPVSSLPVLIAKSIMIALMVLILASEPKLTRRLDFLYDPSFPTILPVGIAPPAFISYCIPQLSSLCFPLPAVPYKVLH